jgi:cytidylate kinase
LVTPPQNRRLVVAIDGPSGVGKGTVSRALAAQLDYRHIDTGAMYRAIAWRALQRGMPLDDESALGALAARATIEVDGGVVAIDGVDITRAIRTAAIDAASARVAKVPAVRQWLVARQRALAKDGGVVMEGRDIGTVVLPDADVKIYLDATPDERAQARGRYEPTDNRAQRRGGGGTCRA